MTPSVRKLLKLKLNESDVNSFLSLLDVKKINLAKGSDSVLAALMIEYTDYDYGKLSELLNTYEKNRIEVSEILSNYKEWMSLCEYYLELREPYYQEFAEALVSVSHSIDTCGLEWCTSHSALCFLKPNGKDFSPIAFVVPLVNGEIFLTKEQGINEYHKLPRLADEFPGKRVDRVAFKGEINIFLREAARS